MNQIIPHEEYTGWDSDIALIKLDDSATLTEWVQLICLPSSDDLSDVMLDGVRDEFHGPDQGWVSTIIGMPHSSIQFFIICLTPGRRLG